MEALTDSKIKRDPKQIAPFQLKKKGWHEKEHKGFKQMFI